MADVTNLETRTEQLSRSFCKIATCSLYGVSLLGIGVGVLGGMIGDDALRRAGIGICYGAQAIALPALLYWMHRETDCNPVTTHQ